MKVNRQKLEVALTKALQPGIGVQMALREAERARKFEGKVSPEQILRDAETLGKAEAAKLAREIVEAFEE